jgi:hypothetical protein
MSVSNLIRWGAMAAILAGAFYIVGGLASSPLLAEEGQSFYSQGAFGHLLEFAGSAALVVGLVGLYLYLRPSPRFGRLGTVGFYVLIVLVAYEAILPLIALTAGSGAAEGFDSYGGPPQAVGKIVGTVLFGIAVLRSGGLPRAGAWLLILGVGVYLAIVVSFIVGPEAFARWGFPLANGLYGLGLIVLGYGLWSHRGEPVQSARPARVS